MLIHVVYKNGKEDMVEPKFLDILLHLGEIQEFRRDDHWVDVSTDPTRSYEAEEYSGYERRQHQPADLSTPLMVSYG